MTTCYTHQKVYYKNLFSPLSTKIGGKYTKIADKEHYDEKLVWKYFWGLSTILSIS